MGPLRSPIPRLSAWTILRTTATGLPIAEVTRPRPHRVRFFRSSNLSQEDVVLTSIRMTASLCSRPISERFRVNCQGVVEAYLARIVDQETRLFHRVFGKFLQVFRSDANVGERHRYIA